MQFVGHYTCRNAETNLKSATTDGFKFRIINSLMASFGDAQGPGSTSKLIHSLKPFEFLKENFVQTIPHIRLKVLEITENVMLFQQSEISIC